MLRRVDDDPCGTVIDEGAIPARPHEAVRLRGAQEARVAYGLPGQGRLVHADDGEPVVVVRALRAVGGGLTRRTAELQGGRESVVVEPHERVPETVDAAVALVAGARVLADLPRLPRSAHVDRRRDARDEPVREPCATAGVVAPRQHILQVGQREVAVARVRPPYGVHDAVATREDEAALGARRRLDRGHRGPWILTVADEHR